MTECLKVENLVTGYGTTVIVREVSLAVEQGEVLCVLGLNGAGKTTMLKALAGLLPYTGSVFLNQVDLSNKSGAVINRSGLAYVPQEGGVFPGLSVDEHLRLSRHFQDDNRPRQDQILDLFPILRDRLSQNAQTLSGGERKMLGIVMALSSSPTVVIMDEPTEGVAPVVREQLVQSLQTIAHTVSAVIVEQNLDTALALNCRGLVMEQGRIVADGQVREMYESGQLEKLLAV